jgi:ABC-type Zn2+ transport system substrate-binding protein/surface adhesin
MTEWEIIRNDVRKNDYMIHLISSIMYVDVSVLPFDFVVYDDSHNVDHHDHNHHQDHHQDHHNHHHRDIVVSYHHHRHPHPHDIHQVLSHDENLSILVDEVVDDSADVVVVVCQVFSASIAWNSRRFLERHFHRNQPDRSTRVGRQE